MMEQDWVLSVSDLNEYVRRSLAADPMLQGLRLRGEISNFKRHSSGHWYFTLKDAQSRINCVMFRQYNMGVSLRPADGMAVIVSGSVSLYVKAPTSSMCRPCARTVWGRFTRSLRNARHV